MKEDSVSITWIPLWKCNFNCIYCDSPLKTNSLEFQPLDKIMDVFDNFIKIVKKNSNIVKVTLSGGEPSIYPNFFEIVKYFTRVVDSVSLCTNLSFDAQKFLNIFKNSADKVSINPTFHPSCMKLEYFMNNLKVLKPFIFNKNNVNFVADKYNIKELDNVIKEINSIGIKVNVLTFKYYTDKIIKTENIEQKKYDSLEVLNSEKEIHKIKQMKEKQGLSLSEYETGQTLSFGKKCLAGYKYIQIFPNGNIRRCTLDKTYLGNIFDKDLHIYDEPHKCVKKYCMHQFNYIIEE